MSNNNQSAAEEDVIDLRELFFNLVQNWKIILLTTVLSLLFALFYLRVTLPVYSADAMLQIDSGKSAGQMDLFMGDIGGLGGDSKVQTEIEIIKSRKILREVAKNLNLDIQLNPYFDSFFSKLFDKKKLLNVVHDETGVSYADELEKIKISQFNVADDLLDIEFLVTPINNKEYELRSLGDEVAVLIRANNNEKSIQNTEFGNIEIHLNFENPKRAFVLEKLSDIKLTKALLEDLSASEKAKKTGILSLAYAGIDKNNIRNTLNEIVDIYAAHNLAQSTFEKEKTIEFLDEQLPQIKAELEQAESNFNNFRVNNKTIDVSKEAEIYLEQSVTLGQTKLQLEQKRAELSTRFTDAYPLLKQIDVQLDKINSELKKLNIKLNGLPNIQQEYLTLKRDVQINTQLYTGLLENYQKLKIAKSGELGNVKIIDRAVRPIKPIKPKKILILLLSLIVGFFIGTTIILLKQLFNKGIKDSSIIENVTGLPVLANVPSSKVQRSYFSKFSNKKNVHNLLFEDSPHDMAIESLRSLRTSLFFAMSSAKNNVITITGPAPGIGKSFISANFAAVLASSDKSVLIIDGDLRRGYLHEHFGLNNELGLSDYLLSGSVQNLIKDTMVTNLKFVSRGKNPDNPTELLMSENFEKLLLKLSEKFDYVIIDSPPTLAVTDGSIFASLAGTTLVVARFGVSDIKEIKLTTDRLKNSGSNVAGIIFNDVKKEIGNTYGYQYGYNYNSK